MTAALGILAIIVATFAGTTFFIKLYGGAFEGKWAAVLVVALLVLGMLGLAGRAFG